MEEKDFFWLVGLLEGEGSFQAPPPSAPRSSRIRLKMTDRDVVERASLLMGGYTIFHIVSKTPNWKDCYDFKVTGERAVWLMIAFYSQMGVRRQQQIARAIAGHPAKEFLGIVGWQEAIARWQQLDLKRR